MSGGFKGGAWNAKQGSRRYILEAAPITKQDAEKIAFFAKLENLSRDIDMPYVDVLKRARDDGFFDATDEQIEIIAGEIK